jgi:predicted SnoaL-like aldol condensation-catalyzing enzyme
MAPEDNKRLVRHVLEEIYAKGRVELADELVHPEFAVRHIYIWRVADGKIADHWGSRDDLGLLTQLGLLSDS